LLPYSVCNEIDNQAPETVVIHEIYICQNPVKSQSINHVGKN
jgi:hypothetical protein